MSKTNDSGNENIGAGALICIPTYNEAENITRIVPAVFEQLPATHILIIDDNSPDETGKLADEMAAKDERIHVLHREKKEGLGAAYLAAFSWALERDYRFVFEFDADFSHNPKYLPVFLRALDVYDLIIGSRRVPGGGVENWQAHRRLISWGGSFYARTILGCGIRDLTGGFNCFRREVLESLDLEAINTMGYGFQIEIKFRSVQAGFKVKELPIVFPDRVRGVSKMNSSLFFEAMWQVIKMRVGK